MFKYKPKCVEEIVVREFSFDFPDKLDPVWIPNKRVRSHFYNGVSLTMPYLEPFLVKTARESANHIKSDELRVDIRAFCGQETQHFKCHRRLNEVLRTNGYPEFGQVEEDMAADWKKLLDKDLEWRLAYSAGFECMTDGFTRWMINKRRELFMNADRHITSFWLMHMIEETEHKTVALDCYMAYSGRYWPRARGVLQGTFHVLGWSISAMFTALRKDGVLGKPSTWWEILRESLSLAYNIGPVILKALLPWHDPRAEADPSWMKDWVDGHARLPAEEPLPLLDTADPSMPVPFAPVTNE